VALTKVVLFLFVVAEKLPVGIKSLRLNFFFFFFFFFLNLVVTHECFKNLNELGSDAKFDAG
jgi:hypothetical protein